MPSPAGPFRSPQTDAEPVRLTRAFAAAVARHADLPAVVSDTGALTYAELDRRSAGWAGHLAFLGVAPGEVVAVERSADPGSVAALLAVLRAGAIVLPLDPVLPGARRDGLLAATGARGVLAHRAGSWSLDGLPLLDKPSVDVEHPHAYVFTTSGSTGTPKAVLGAHSGLGHFLAWQRDAFGIGPGDLVAQLTGWSFDVCLRELFTPLVSGAAVVLPPPGPPTGARVFEFAARTGVTVLHAVPSLARRWLAEARPLPSVRATFFAGEQLTGELVTAWRRAVPGAVVNLYGPTETTLAKFAHVVPDPAPAGPLPVGSPLPGVEAALVDGGLETARADGAEGEIVLRTRHRGAGYLDGNPFHPNPFTDDPDDLLYRTGDLGRFDEDGLLRVLGRVDDQVKVRGVRLALREVGAALDAAPGVRQAAVVRRDGPDGVELVAFVAGGPVPAAVLRAAVLDRLPAAAVPAEFVFLPEIPLLPNGKVDRRALGETVATAPAPVRPEWDGLAGLVAGICRDVLGRAPERPEQDLFDLGADSLTAVEIAARLEDELAFEVPLGLVYQEPTVARIVDALRGLGVRA
ncbi:non-ribosomal peptide synthetase [Actinosynnema pretiosum]|uniref:Carrier domain-containing protein n=1 Tax=Actinosynnema pretiosum TaxID=42197 RepID=A0A290Z6Y3_9PSEU|nr:non-ribosomal peptide synthetase [Actinosynnema pretiosum]ATE54756.1 hypothetical protein CNX65_16925 [Actinosynnema pretiosum]